ncbi:hypothetical protein JX266_011105 [Neoarthrinium moseri]|nr:hypothetical protein JX266_011105 [Neoarthrinium moseri]
MFDGSAYRYRRQALIVAQFEGARRISELSAYPLSFHSDLKVVTQRLKDRGLKSLEYQSMLCREYKGRALDLQNLDPEYHRDDDDKKNSRQKYYDVSGRVVVDAAAARYHTYNLMRAQQRLQVPNTASENSAEQEALMKAFKAASGIADRPPNQEEQEVNRQMIGSIDLWLMIMEAHVPGFVLKEKRWFWLCIDQLCPPQWIQEAFDQLVLPEGRKDMVLSFVDTHQKTRKFGSDIISGKGKGLVVLLAGPTGTGKTLTVEAVSERAERPLYHLQAGELGSNPASVNQALKKAFALCSKWDAALLLDEADALIRSRRHGNYAQEDLCCVLLATLEYYSGVIFLTTNLPEDIDDAVASRLDIHLNYPNLDFSARLQLWRSFLYLSKDNSDDECVISLSDDELQTVALWEINGRDIKHTAKNARKWCYIKGDPITRSALEVALQVTVPDVTTSHIEGGNGTGMGLQTGTRKRRRSG